MSKHGVGRPPTKLVDSKLMRRLEEYSSGASWSPSYTLSSDDRTACKLLHAQILSIVDNCFEAILGNIAYYEMSYFTMHDKRHALKVCHLMWHALTEDRRSRLTPVEIGILVLSAYFHDLGMALTDDERSKRLSPKSDLWDTCMAYPMYHAATLALQENVKTLNIADPNSGHTLQQSAHALLCLDTRDRHATRERYLELIENLDEHCDAQLQVPNFRKVTSYQGDSFLEELIEVCVSHNEPAHVLTDPNRYNPDQPRFPTDSAFANCSADINLLATLLRVADILDFDRDRTPTTVFYHLLNTGSFPDISIAEWSKHMAITQWQIKRKEIEYIGRCESEIVHDSILKFVEVIERELVSSSQHCVNWKDSIRLPLKVTCKITSVGYKYVPFNFQLNTEKIFDLLMGPQLYRHRLDAFRELIQNSVDACRLRSLLSHIRGVPSIDALDSQIVVELIKPDGDRGSPKLIISDFGIGMTIKEIEQYLVHAGSSFYTSRDFSALQKEIREAKRSFRPAAKFGLGFLSTFMLGKEIIVETSSWLKPRAHAIHLKINGIARLFRLKEQTRGSSVPPEGTKITIHLAPTDHDEHAFTDTDILAFWFALCDYANENFLFDDVNLQLVYRDHDGKQIDCRSLSAIHGFDEKNAPELIDVEISNGADEVRGQIIYVPKLIEQSEPAEFPVAGHSVQVVRSGFRVCSVTDVPLASKAHVNGRIEMQPRPLHVHSTTDVDVSRSRLVDPAPIERAIYASWVNYFLKDTNKTKFGKLGVITTSSKIQDALAPELTYWDIFTFLRKSWLSTFKDSDEITAWERRKKEAIRLSGHQLNTLQWHCAEVIFPGLTQLILKERGSFFLAKPHRQWRSKLRNSSIASHGKQSWGLWCKYDKSINDLFMDIYAARPFLNIEYKDILNSYSDEELTRIANLATNCTEAIAYQDNSRLSLTLNDIELLQSLSNDHPTLMFRRNQIQLDAVSLHQIASTKENPTNVENLA